MCLVRFFFFQFFPCFLSSLLFPFQQSSWGVFLAIAIPTTCSAACTILAGISRATGEIPQLLASEDVPVNSAEQLLGNAAIRAATPAIAMSTRERKRLKKKKKETSQGKPNSGHDHRQRHVTADSSSTKSS